MKFIAKYKYIIGGVVLIIVAIFIYSQVNNSSSYSSPESSPVVKQEKVNKDIKKEIEIIPGSAFSSLLKQEGIEKEIINNIYQTCQDQYDLAKIKAGKNLELIYSPDRKLKKLKYKIDEEKEVVVDIDKDKCFVHIQDIPYTTKVMTKSATIDTSLYQSALDNGIDEGLIIALANAFQWSIDFSMDTKKGDSFKVIYEEKYLEGKDQGPGKILAARYINNGQAFDIYYFEENKNNKGYFDDQGNSVQKMFLKAPVAFKYISSGFTTGKRYVQKFNVSTGHRAIDYAAPIGTPIRAVGDGVITFVGWAGPYGNKISIRHNATYSTNYAHLSKFAVKKGQRVKQGEVIGYVGTTGFSTGPHLHFEMVKNGIKINPLKEILPPGEAIKEENKNRFFKSIEKYKKQLEQLK